MRLFIQQLRLNGERHGTNTPIKRRTPYSTFGHSRPLDHTTARTVADDALASGHGHFDPWTSFDFLRHPFFWASTMMCHSICLCVYSARVRVLPVGSRTRAHCSLVQQFLLYLDDSTTSYMYRGPRLLGHSLVSRSRVFGCTRSLSTYPLCMRKRKTEINCLHARRALRIVIFSRTSYNSNERRRSPLQFICL